MVLFDAELIEKFAFSEPLGAGFAHGILKIRRFLVLSFTVVSAMPGQELQKL